MQRFHKGVIALRGVAVLVIAMIGGMGCGWIADTDRIVIATLDGKDITRGMLYDVIRDMPDDERPIIRTRQDYIRVLRQYIDREIKVPLGQELAAKGEITIDREAAREQFFKSSGDKEETYRHMWAVPVPKPGEESELMKVYNLKAEDLEAVKNIIESGTDQVVDKAQGDQAVAYLAMKAFDAKELVLDEEALKMEYELNKDNFKTLETLTIRGLQFPTAKQGASVEATSVRDRLNKGENFDLIFDEFIQRDITYGFESIIENNPSMERFKGFWQEASGAVVGDVLGPTFMPDYARMKTDATGQAVQETVPESWVVFKVIEAKPAETIPFEQAKGYVAGPVAFTAMMDKLWEEHGAEIFEDKIEQPQGGNKDIFED